MAGVYFQHSGDYVPTAGSVYATYIYPFKTVIAHKLYRLSTPAKAVIVLVDLYFSLPGAGKAVDNTHYLRNS